MSAASWTRTARLRAITPHTRFVPPRLPEEVKAKSEYGIGGEGGEEERWDTGRHWGTCPPVDLVSDLRLFDFLSHLADASDSVDFSTLKHKKRRHPGSQ
eukprot:182438-Hanusia_phi.AAC.1